MIVMLKPLEWEETLPGVWVADTIIGRYRCDTDRHGCYRVVIPGWLSIDHDTLDAAKAAAETHYRERIAPAVTSPWQPMESAPKDGRKILLRLHSGCGVAGFWATQGWTNCGWPSLLEFDSPIAWMEIPPLEGK